MVGLGLSFYSYGFLFIFIFIYFFPPLSLDGGGFPSWRKKNGRERTSPMFNNNVAISSLNLFSKHKVLFLRYRPLFIYREYHTTTGYDCACITSLP